MVWNPSSEVQVARDAAKALGANIGCVIIYLKGSKSGNPEQLGMVSYGANSSLCAMMRGIGDELYDVTMKRFESWA